jgi:hypothetical protein
VGDWAAAGEGHTSSVSPSGRYLAFQSSANLTGYDNTDPSSPAPCPGAGAICDSEVFLYDAAANGGAGQLLCASCNPSGARPLGPSIVPPQPSQVSSEAAIAQPGWESTTHQQRYLLEDGRLFFDSLDAIVPRDANGRYDVYEYEPDGLGSCESEAQNGGCLSLLSSGRGSTDSAFLDASADGSDVFFTTSDQLLPRDGDGAIDVYDARVGGGFPFTPPPICEGPETCHGEGTHPGREPIFGSGSLEHGPEPIEKPCKKGYVKRHGHCVKVRRHRHKRHRVKHGRAGRNRGGLR